MASGAFLRADSSGTGAVCLDGAPAGGTPPSPCLQVPLTLVWRDKRGRYVDHIERGPSPGAPQRRWQPPGRGVKLGRTGRSRMPSPAMPTPSRGPGGGGERHPRGRAPLAQGDRRGADAPEHPDAAGRGVAGLERQKPAQTTVRGDTAVLARSERQRFQLPAANCRSQRRDHGVSPTWPEAQNRSSIQRCIRSKRLRVAFPYWSSVSPHALQGVPPCVAPSMT